jgi:hypothetical protein
VTEHQLPLFSDISGARAGSAASEAATAEAGASAPSSAADDRQLDLFADRAVLARELDAAIAGGRFEAVAALRARVEDDFGPGAAQTLAPLACFDGVAWDPPDTALSAWADVDRLLAGRPQLREQVRAGVFGRLLRSHRPARLLAARPECLPALARVLRERPDRPPEEGRREARALVRDSLLAGRLLEALDFHDDPAVADLLAEDRDPRWLACLGRIRRLWPSTAPCGAEWESLGQVARGAARADHPALAFWGCLRLAESADCPDDLRQQARRRMKQLDPELHALFMRHATHP